MSVETSSPISSVQVLIPQQQWADVKSRLGTAEARLADLTVALEIAAETADLNRFMALAMALCNILALRYNARRVSLGILRSRSVHVMAMNQTEKILRKMQLVRDVEEAMEECLDQDAEILFPSAADGNVITRCAAKITSIHGTGTVLAMPLRRDGCVGVLLMEFEPGRHVTSAELAPLRTIADLLTPRIMDLYEHDRWFGARWMRDWRKYLSKLVGPTHTWIKAAAIAITLFLLWAFFAKGTFHIIAQFTLEPVRQAQVVAPFDGYIKAVKVRPGDAIIAKKTVLAELHTAKLRDQLAAAQAQYAAYAKQSDVAQSKGKIADMQIADDSMNGALAKIRLLKRQIAHATITSPISGVVLTGNLLRRIGAPVHLGDVLFKVAPIKPLLARINVQDGDILYVKDGQKGSLATASYPADKISLSVTHIDPLAMVKHKQNIFRVRAVLKHPPSWFRPGMQGTARINAGKRRYIWIWTRGLINWIRMKLWL